MKWFKHDSDASIDAKIERLIMRYGLEGYGLYFYCLELVVASIEEHNLNFELEHDAEIIGHRTGTHPEHVQEMMRFMVHLGLFEDTNGQITCYKIAKRLDSSMTSNPRLRQIIKGFHGESHDVVMTASCHSHDSIMLEEKRREEKIRSGEISFSDFWAMWPRKEDKKKAEKAWNALTVENQKKAMAHFPSRYAGTDKKYIPLPTTYIHGHRWEDEAIESSQCAGGEVWK